MSWLMALALQAGVAGGAADCQAAIGDLHDGPEIGSLPNQVDGATIRGAAGLAQLRASRPGPIVVNGGTFARADFRRVGLRNICFVGTDLSGSDWRGTLAPGLAFIGTSLEGANLAGARLPRLLLRQSNLKNVDASRADLSGGKMDGGWDGSVEDLRLNGANLRGFRFDCGITVGDGCPLEGEMVLTGADLTGASLASYFRFSDWSGARIDRTEIGLAQLTDLSAADLRGPIRVRGGDKVVEISPAEYRILQPHMLASDPERRGELIGRPGRPGWARPGNAVLFVDPVLVFAPAFRSHPLYRRLLPVVIGGASARLVVRVNANGSIQAAGDAVGGNAHLCSLAGEKLAYDRNSGWYSGPHEDDADTPRAFRGRPMPVLRFQGDWAEVYRGGRGGFEGSADPRESGYASCGARASFGDLMRVPVTRAEAEAMLRSYAQER